MQEVIKRKQKYTQLQIPQEFEEKIQAHVKNYPEDGYTIEEFIREALREHLKNKGEYKQKREKKKNYILVQTIKIKEKEKMLVKPIRKEQNKSTKPKKSTKKEEKKKELREPLRKKSNTLTIPEEKKEKRVKEQLKKEIDVIIIAEVKSKEIMLVHCQPKVFPGKGYQNRWERKERMQWIHRKIYEYIKTSGMQLKTIGEIMKNCQKDKVETEKALTKLKKRGLVSEGTFSDVQTKKEYLGYICTYEKQDSVMEE